MAHSSPASHFDDLKSYSVRSSTDSGGENVDNSQRLLGFDGQVPKRATNSGKMTIESSPRFEGRELEPKISPKAASEQLIKIKSITYGNINVQKPQHDDHDKNRHQAAVKLQKTYKSFRTRRQLADCAVLVEQRWWKLLDFVELKHNSISFFDIEKPETAVARWSRARTKASKVGKGLSKDDNARKLALQHWLEAIDPRHRYGHNLQFYYVNWLHCDSKQPFFYWLDIGDGREVNLERCSRLKLQQQCIKYLGPSERSSYEVVVVNGKLMYKENGKVLDTRRKEGARPEEDVKWIFVLSVSKILYVGQKKKGTFQHSSFLAGGATLSAGRLVVEEGILKAVWPHSGHYLPTEENFEEFMAFLEKHSVDLSLVQRAPNEEEEFGIVYPKKLKDRSISHNDENNSKSNSENNMYQKPVSRWSRKLHSKIALLQIPKGQNVLESFMTPRPSWQPPGSPSDDDDDDENEDDDAYETADEYLSESEFSVSKHNLFNPEEEEECELLEPVVIPKEKIMKRIKSHKGMRSYQLAKQLSCRWTTGAGPRIGCLRDYPTELQFRVLEDVSLSPRSDQYSSPRRSRARSSSGIPTPKNHQACRERSPLAGGSSSAVSPKFSHMIKP